MNLKKSLSKVSIFAVLLFALLTIGCEKENELTENQSIRMYAEITFLQPTSFSDAQNVVDTHNLEIINIQSQKKVGERYITQGTNDFSDIDNLLDVQKRFEEYYVSLRKNVIEKIEIENRENSESFKSVKSLENQIQKDLQSNGDITVKNITVITDDEKFKELQKLQNTLVQEVKTGKKEDKKETTENYKSSSLPNWVPDACLTYTGQHPNSNNHRFAIQAMTWNVPFSIPYNPNYNIPASKAVYEHEFLLNANEGSVDGPEVYFATAIDDLDQPLTTYWDSTLPESYLDTQFLDSWTGGEASTKSYTIGCGDPYSISYGYQHWNYSMMVLANGLANTDKASLQGQLLKKVTNNCNPVTCAFVKDDHWISSPANQVIGGVNYTHHWTINVPGYTVMSNY